MTHSRNSHELIWGAFIGALFLWGGASWYWDLTASLSWVALQWPMFFVLCVASPILEEYVFRGMLYEFIDARCRKVWFFGDYLSISFANATTTVLFVITHMITREPMVGALVLVPSLYLGLLRHRYGSIGVCMLIHALWNIGWFSLFPPA
ncbi:MAG: JDVT-CTERM system glutamic-type intramembrane protease [Pseudomonadales bacterium]|nr:JDVT-CTERM system glutamic-type intramembrane protease [Pseudomonadales bacterium]